MSSPTAALHDGECVSAARGHEEPPQKKEAAIGRELFVDVCARTYIPTYIHA